MKINIDEMPENKTFDDYPSDTEFVLRENFPRILSVFIPMTPITIML